MEIRQIYRCGICGNIIEVLHVGGGRLVCCARTMDLLMEKTTDEGMEKHVPVMEIAGGGIRVKVGAIPHPMEEGHYIRWIELIADGEVHRRFLKPGDAPEALFTVSAETVYAREYCNLHGLWKSAPVQIPQIRKGEAAEAKAEAAERPPAPEEKKETGAKAEAMEMPPVPKEEKATKKKASGGKAKKKKRPPARKKSGKKKPKAPKAKKARKAGKKKKK